MDSNERGDYYTAMVTAASNYADLHPTSTGHPVPMPAPPHPRGAGHLRSTTSYCLSADSSISSISNQGPHSSVSGPYPHSAFSSGVYAQGHHSQQVPSSAVAAPLRHRYQQAGAATSYSRYISGSEASSKGVYAHNPYATPCTPAGCLSVDTSMESYQSFYSAYSSASTTPAVSPHARPVNGPNNLSGSGEEGGISGSYSIGNPRQQQRNSQRAPQQSYQQQQQTEGCLTASSGYASEQFINSIGNIPATACTAPGRHLLTSVLRAQDAGDVEIIYNELLPELNTICFDPQANVVVRCLIEVITTEQLDDMILIFTDETILRLATSHQNTRRLLHFMFEQHTSESLMRIVNILAPHSQRLACNQQGYIAIMRIIEHALPAQKYVMIDSLMNSLPTLTKSPYGNYVVQCILQNSDPSMMVEKISCAFSGHWVPLSCNKFASNVMEKVIALMSGDARKNVVAELILDEEKLQCMMQDGYGNFVVQAIICSSKDTAEFDAICSAVTPQLPASPYGQKIGAKIRAMFPTFHGGTAQPSSAASLA